MSLESEVRSFDDWMDALGNVQRRLLALPLTYEEQTDVLVVGGGASIGDAPGPHVQMEHVHLPQLDAYGLNEWDRASGEIVRGPAFCDLEPLLELLRDHQTDLPAGLF